MIQTDKGEMFQDEEKSKGTKPAAADREPYRRLIDLQKQMIELVQQHARTKRECTALREQLLEEMAQPRRRWTLQLDTGWLKNFSTLGSSGWWWARNRTIPLFLPAKPQTSTRFTRTNPGKL
jgi:hypothetical protein